MCADSPRTIDALDTTCELLEELQARNGAGVTELASSLDTTKSTVHHHLATLSSHGLVQKREGEYHLGLRFLTYGGTARERDATFEYAKADVDSLARKSGETARLVVKDGRYGQTTHYRAGKHASEPTTRLGEREPLHSSATGKALLAALPERDVEDVLEADLHRVTPNTTTDPTELRAELEAIRNRMIAFDDEERRDGIRGVASPFIKPGDTNDVLGAVGISGPVERIPDKRFREELPATIKRSVEVIKTRDEVLADRWTWFDSGD